MGEKFTPGPWSTSHRQVPGDPNGFYSTQVYDAQGRAIATCEWYPVECSFGVVRTNRDANAQLIAAAPDLLAAAKAALNDRMYRESPQIADLLQAAIAKAEGSPDHAPHVQEG